VIVVDASAAVPALLRDGPARGALSDQPLHAPHLVDAEVTSALCRSVGRQELDTALAWSLLQRWRVLGVDRHPVSGLLDRMWELRESLTPYDASYVALAERLGCPLLTADIRLTRAPGVRCPVTVVPG
jgi:predicted nucleic acid-binding protein